MKDPIRERLRAVVPELIGVTVLGMLMATVVEALSPENLLRKDSAVEERVNRPA
jgi:hypothetical protein